MRTYFFIIIALLFCTTGQTQAIDAIIKKYKYEEQVSKSSMTSSVMRLFAKDYHQRKVIDKIDKLEVYIFDKAVSLSTDEIKSIKNELKSKKYDLLINIRDKDLKVDIYVEDKKDRIKKLFMLVLSGEEKQVLADMKCDLSYEDFQNLKLDFLGSENLQLISNGFK